MTFGCGAYTCKTCYPFQYGCDYCSFVFQVPLENGKDYICEECGFESGQSA
jgi:hypothetical protein